jgi:peptidoglycan/LPS O-acetylase OafA/YrhL
MEGLFLNYWLCFGVGCAVYLLLHRPQHRLAAVVMLGAALVSAAVERDLPLAVSLGTSAVMLALARVDRDLSSSLYARPFVLLGVVSYSLYLVHVPIGGRVTNGLSRINAPAGLVAPLAIAVSIAAAALFFFLVERHSLPRRSQSAPAAAPLVA